MDTSERGSNGPSPQRRNSMTPKEEQDRRASIQAIMKDPNLTAQERRKSIQSLMDGRRRSSAAPENGGGMAAAAAAAAMEFDDSSFDDEEDEGEEEDDDDDAIIDTVAAASAAGGKRPSFMKRTSTSEKSSKRRASLRESFTMGFSNMGVKNVSNEELSRKLELSRPPCGHYERNCSMVSPCCGMVFGCRICHDDFPNLPPPFLLQLQNNNRGVGEQCLPVAASASNSKHPAIVHRSASLPPNFAEEETHHTIDRFAVKEVICRECFTRQSSKTNNCISCDIQFGSYHCSICNLWMSADEDPYHCLKCGFCRVGGRENFTHCDECGMCIDALLFDDHNCKSGKYMSNCPVCQEDLFSSRMASHEMPCGHAIHWHCFRDLTSHDTRCPICKKTAETHDQMEPTWSAMAMGIALQPVPADMARVVDILCNDCEEKGANQRWHFLGVQCLKCTSFNTTVERTVLVGQEAADYLGPPDEITAEAHISSEADQNVLAALMGAGEAGLALAAGMDSEDEIDTQAMNQSVTAEVMGIMNRTHPSQRHPTDRSDGMDESSDEMAE